MPYYVSRHDIEGAVHRAPDTTLGTPPPSFIDAMHDRPPTYDFPRMVPDSNIGSRSTAPRPHRHHRLPPLLRGFTRPDSAVPTAPPSHPPPSYAASQRPTWSRWFSSARSTSGSPPLPTTSRQQLDTDSAIAFAHPSPPLSSSLSSLPSHESSPPAPQIHAQEVTALTMTDSGVADARLMLSLSSYLERPPAAHTPEGLASPPHRQNQSPRISSNTPNADMEAKATGDDSASDDDDMPLRLVATIAEAGEKQLNENAARST